MDTTFKLDQVDLKLLDLLKENSKITIKNLAKAINLSTTPVFERIKKLEKNGIIQNYTINIDEKLLGKKFVAFAHISLSVHTKKHFQKLESDLLAIKEIVEVHAVSGNTDFIVKIHVSDIDDYKSFIMEKLFGVPNIGNIESFISLDMKRTI